MTPSSRSPGFLIAIEGIDASGKSTQAEELRRFLVNIQARLCTLTREPSDGVLGATIRTALSRPQPLRPSSPFLALMFAADRLSHLAVEILPRLEAGEVVICDRYILSSLAYQGSAIGNLEWIHSLNRYAVWPDLTIYLRVTPEQATERLQARGQPLQSTEQAESLQRAAAAYDQLAETLKDDPSFVVIEGYHSREYVHESIFDAVDKALTEQATRTAAARKLADQVMIEELSIAHNNISMIIHDVKFLKKVTRPLVELLKANPAAANYISLLFSDDLYPENTRYEWIIRKANGVLDSTMVQIYKEALERISEGHLTDDPIPMNEMWASEVADEALEKIRKMTPKPSTPATTPKGNEP